MRTRAIAVVALVAAVPLLLRSRRKTSPAGTVQAHAPTDQPSTPTRRAIVALAASEVGKSDPERYWSIVSGPKGHPHTSWCAAFALWLLRTLGLVDWTYDDAGAWFYRLPATTEPGAGDLVFFPAAGKRHLAVVERVSGKGLDLINGAGSGGKVSRSFVTWKRLSDERAEMFSVGRLGSQNLAA